MSSSDAPAERPIERRGFGFSYENEPARRVRGRVHRPTAVAQPPWVLVLHGFKGFLGWGFFPLLCDALARRGVAAIACNLSGCGVGDDGETFSELDAFARDTLSRRLQDVDRVRDLALDGGLGPLSPSRRALFGHSAGGALAIVHAAEDRDYRAVATWAALDDFDRWDDGTKALWRRQGVLHVTHARTGQELPLGVGLLEDFERNAARFDVRAAARRLRCPLLLLHGSEDTVVQPDSGRALQAAAPGAEPLILLEGLGHTLGAVHPQGPPAQGLSSAIGTTADWLASRLSRDSVGGAARA